LVTLIELWTAPIALAEEQPRRGGILQVVQAGGSPSLDMHQEETLVLAQPLGSVYNTLIHFDKQLRSGTEELYIFSASR
jgi:hypothetical protein